MPGEYTVQMGKRINGVVTPLGAPQSFTVKSLDNSPEIATDRAAVLAFQEETADLARAVYGAGDASLELRNRVQFLKVALEALEQPVDAQRTTIQQIETLLDQSDMALFGDRSVASRNEPVPFSILQRVGQIVGWGWNHQSPVTGSDKSAFQIAKSEFQTVLGQLRDVELRVETLEDELAAQGAPYIPGSGVPNFPG